jgi:hypothetical protein
MYGGFAGTETTPDQRAGNHVITLDAALQGPSTLVAVVFCSGLDRTTTIGGFTIMNGTGDLFCDGGSHYYGGIFCSDASIAISTCTFTRDTADSGAAVAVSGGAIKVTNCVITQCDTKNGVIADVGAVGRRGTRRFREAAPEVDHCRSGSDLPGGRQAKGEEAGKREEADRRAMRVSLPEAWATGCS